MGVEGTGGFDRATDVVVRDIGFQNKRVGLRDCGDPRQAKFLDQAVRMGEKTALQLSLGVGTERDNHPDVDLAQGAEEERERRLGPPLLNDNERDVEEAWGVRKDDILTFAGQRLFVCEDSGFWRRRGESELWMAEVDRIAGEHDGFGFLKESAEKCGDEWTVA